ncbi:hypothetical protein Tco_1272568 [Tanacetum coccineum]
MQEVILFYNGLDVPTRQILDSKGSIPTKTAADAKVAIQEMAEYSQKWHNGREVVVAPLPSCEALFMEKETKGTNVEQNKKNKMSNVDRPFTEVQNRRVDYEKGKESKNYYKGNGFNGSFNNQRYSGNQNRFYNGRGNVGK